MPPLSADLFDYPLPDRLIAQHPAAQRDASRLLVVNRRTGEMDHTVFRELPRFLRPGDTLIRNNAAVLPARLFAQRPSGGRVECFLLHPVDDTVWWCLLRPGRRLAVGARFAAPGLFEAEVLEKGDEGRARVAFRTPGGEPIARVAQRAGEVPLPPYISRPDPARDRAEDRARYQTVYARDDRAVAVAAPTAGLHFTPELLARLTADGVATADVTLHVGLGTFRPIATETIEAHAIHREVYEIPPATQHLLFRPPGRRIAVGTTSVRSIEDFLRHQPAPLAPERAHFTEAAIYLFPPAEFRGVDALITNFHQPRSTLLCLVAAFLAPGSTDGIDLLHRVYREAVAREYRFLSYGDAMLIL